MNYKTEELEIGNAGLRCGDWGIKNLKKKKNKLLLGWHLGKCYAYLYVLHYFGLTNLIPKKNIKEYKGWINCFPKLKMDPAIIIKKEFFDAVLMSGQELNSEVAKDIRKECKEIK